MSEDTTDDTEQSYFSVEDANGDLIMSIRTTDGEEAKELVAEQTGYEYDDLQLPTEKGSDTPFVGDFGKQSHRGNDSVKGSRNVGDFGKQSHRGNDSVKGSRNVGDFGKQDTDETKEDDSEQDEGTDFSPNYGSYGVTD